MTATMSNKRDNNNTSIVGRNHLDCDGSKCHSECELRHLDEFEEKVRQSTKNTSSESTCSDVAKEQPKLIIVAGPERSGSTWMYNAVRHLYSAANIECDSYWIHHLTRETLDDRLAEGRTVVIKTHKYYSSSSTSADSIDGDYDSWLFKNGDDTNSYNPIVLMTHRDLRDVLLSYRRLGWAYDIPSYYVKHHLQWLEHSALDLSFKEIINDTPSALQKIAQACQINAITNDNDGAKIIALAQERLSNLKPATSNGVDQVTKHWPSHIKASNNNDTESNKNKFDYLLERFPEFYDLYSDL